MRTEDVFGTSIFNLRLKDVLGPKDDFRIKKKYEAIGPQWAHDIRNVYVTFYKRFRNVSMFDVLQTFLERFWNVFRTLDIGMFLERL